MEVVGNFFSVPSSLKGLTLHCTAKEPIHHQVMNKTGSVLHYFNQESMVKFYVQTTSLTYTDHGYISVSPYKNDTVPFKS